MTDHETDIYKVVEEFYGDILLRVGAYARKLINAYTWFRGTEALPGGMTANDFALEALTRLLENTTQFDTGRSEITVNNIVAYLNRNIVRNLVRGAREKEENKHSDDLHDETFEKSLPFAEILLDEQMGIQTIKEFFENTLANEEELYELFIGIYEEGLSRSEVCEQLDIPPDEYDRRMKRLGNRISKASIIFAKDAAK